jgi:hypothetical protein
MRLLASNPAPAMAGESPLPTGVHDLRGDDPGRWRTDIPTFAGVRYHDVYPGIDLAYHGNGGELEYDFVVAPGADPATIRLAFGGVDGAALDGDGDLVLSAASGELRHRRPVVDEEVAGGRRTVPSRFVLHDGGEVVFQVGPSTRPARW